MKKRLNDPLISQEMISYRIYKKNKKVFLTSLCYSRSDNFKNTTDGKLETHLYRIVETLFSLITRSSEYYVTFKKYIFIIVIE